MAILEVQKGDSSTGPTASGTAFNLGANVTAGNGVILHIATSTPGSTATVTSGSGGMTNWARIGTRINVTGAEGAELWWGTSASGASKAFTVTATGGYYAQATEFSGLGTLGTVAQTGPSVAGSPAHQTITSTAGQLVVAMCVCQTALTAFTGLTSDYNGAATGPAWRWSSGLDSAYQVATLTSYAPSWTSGAGTWGVIAATINAGVAVVLPPVTRPARTSRLVINTTIRRQPPPPIAAQAHLLRTARRPKTVVLQPPRGHRSLPVPPQTIIPPVKAPDRASRRARVIVNQPRARAPRPLGHQEPIIRPRRNTPQRISRLRLTRVNRPLPSRHEPPLTPQRVRPRFFRLTPHPRATPVIPQTPVNPSITFSARPPKRVLAALRRGHISPLVPPQIPVPTPVWPNRQPSSLRRLFGLQPRGHQRLPVQPQIPVPARAPDSPHTRARGLMTGRGHRTPLIPAQDPAPQRITNKHIGVTLRRSKSSPVVPVQLITPPVKVPIVPQRARLLAAMRRGHITTVPATQAAPIASPLVLPTRTPRRLIAALSRGHQSSVVPPQIPVPKTVIPTRTPKRLMAGLRRGRQSIIVPSQLVVQPPAFVLSRPVPKKMLLASRKGHVTTPLPTQDLPLPHTARHQPLIRRVTRPSTPAPLAQSQPVAPKPPTRRVPTLLRKARPAPLIPPTAPAIPPTLVPSRRAYRKLLVVRTAGRVRFPVPAQIPVPPRSPDRRTQRRTIRGWPRIIGRIWQIVNPAAAIADIPYTATIILTPDTITAALSPSSATVPLSTNTTTSTLTVETTTTPLAPNQMQIES